MAHARITERRGTIGVLKGNGENEIFQCKANFSLRIVAKVEGAKDGYIARVTRAPDNVTTEVPSHIVLPKIKGRPIDIAVAIIDACYF